MPRKLQSFYVLKLATDRLKNSNYKINISLNEARRNGEIVRLGDSELLRAVRRIREQDFSQELLDTLLLEKLKLSRKNNTPENRKNIQVISDKIDKILYQEDIIVLSIKDVRHYKKVIENGLWVNGRRFSRLLCSAGHARRSSTIFCADEIKDKIDEFLNCGRSLDEKINLNKYNAYQGLASSATLPVTRPIFVVVPDCEVKRKIKVDWFIPQEDGVDPIFEEKELEQTFNLFDGQGLISPGQAQIWMEDLELDWLPSAFIFRGAFSKGLLVVFDFHKFAQEHNIRKITDIYGTEHWLDDVEVILTLSQFKMAGFYKDLSEYVNVCKKLDFGWGVSRYTPKKDKDSVGTTYQYLQAINIKDESIEEICKPTVEWLQNISGLAWQDVLIFLLGELESFDAKNFPSTDYLAKIIMLEPDCLKDSCVRKKMLRFIGKKIKESYIGTLKVDGNYQFVIADPYAECQHILGLEVTGIVDRGTAYSQYWSKKGITKVSCFRSPMTWRSEQLVLDIDPLVSSWFDHLYSGIVFGIRDDWLMRLSGADLDGDIIMTTPSFTDCKYEGLNVPTYDRQNANKASITSDGLWKSDTLSFGSKIGIITNIGTSFYSMLPVFPDGKEHDLLINRLKSCCVFQNMQIDKTKGINVYSLPSWWDKWSKDGENSEIYNRLLARQRPYFMRYVYASWNKKYKHHLASYENVCVVRFGFSLDTLLKKDVLSETEKKVKDEFFARSPLIDSSCTMNLICHHMEQEVKELKETAKKTVFNHKIYMDESIPIDEAKLHKMNLLFAKWSAFQRNRHDKPFENDDSDDEVFQSKDEYIKVLEREAYYISNNLKELTNLIVKVCYELHPVSSKEFAWKLFEGRGIIENLKERCRGFISVPLLDDSGSYEYLGRKYRIENIVLGELDV